MRAASAPKSWAFLVAAIVADVLIVPVPTMMGSSPPTSSRVTAMISAFSSSLRVEASPVVPRMTTPSVPSSLCHCSTLRSVGMSTSPFSFIGVASATSEPDGSGIPAIITAACGAVRLWLRVLVPNGWPTKAANDEPAVRRLSMLTRSARCRERWSAFARS